MEFWPACLQVSSRKEVPSSVSFLPNYKESTVETRFWSEDSAKVENKNLLQGVDIYIIAFWEPWIIVQINEMQKEIMDFFFGKQSATDSYVLISTWSCVIIQIWIPKNTNE
jgi:hypothetical protein